MIESVCRRIETGSDRAAWIHVVPRHDALGQLDQAHRRAAAGATLPLLGVPFAVKDNIDVAGMPTTAGCPSFRYIASRSASVVDRLLDAGAILVGKTNLDQFACGLAGDRTPFGICRNLFDPRYIAGGSSSGSAVAVGASLVSFALGTDTAGSGRVPAGANNIVGLKPTPGLLPSDGLVPACRSLDCVSIFALTAEDALTVCEIALGGRWPEPTGACNGSALRRFATPREEDLEFFGDAGQERLFRQSVRQFEEWGWKRAEVDFRPFREVAQLLYEGPWVAERWAGVGEFLQKNPDDVHPTTRDIIRSGTNYSAADLFRAQYRLAELRPTCLSVFEQATVLLVPTLPVLPTIAEVEADSRTWVRRLGHYTNFVNLLGLAALAMPAGFTEKGLPGGITLIGPGGSDRKLNQIGKAWQDRLNLPLGATGRKRPAAAAPAETIAPPAAGHVRLAVAGAHLRGQPLHPDLLKTGARFMRACLTAPRYRFIAFMDLKPPRPGLLRDEDRAGSTLVEIYDLPTAGFGALVASVAPPLAIGTIELADGEFVKGFLCESWAAARARDITEFGGWVAFRERDTA